jgi:HEAT repeat protein
LTAWIGAQLSSLDPGRESSVREELVSLLSVQPEGGNVVSMLERLATGDSDEDVRHRAIIYLGRRPEDTSRQLRNIFSRAEEADDRAQALTALANRMGPASKPQLEEAARNIEEAEEVRNAAVNYLSRIEGRDVDTLLERLLSDPDSDFRRRVVRAWARREADRAVPVLERVALNDEESDVREEAVSRIGSFEVPQASTALKRVFDSSEDEDVRRRALRVRLQAMEAGEKVTWLDQVARTDPSFEVKKEAVRQLGRIHTPEALRALQRILNVGR